MDTTAAGNRFPFHLSILCNMNSYLYKMLKNWKNFAPFERKSVLRRTVVTADKTTFTRSTDAVFCRPESFAQSKLLSVNVYSLMNSKIFTPVNMTLNTLHPLFPKPQLM